MTLLLLLALAADPAVPTEEAPAATSPATTPAIDTVKAATILFEADRKKPLFQACAKRATEPERIACLIDVRYASDKKAAKIARALFEKTGSVAGLLPAQPFDGDYRGMLKLVPHLPVGTDRKHLEWFTDGMTEIDAFFLAHAPEKDAPAMRYRWRDLDVRFFRSVKRKTPSAFATGWLVAYNVSGSLFTSSDRVRETLFHEIFHLNDADHTAWSKRELATVYDKIVLKCGKDTKCLTPYAPDSIIVRSKGGTYYAFMPDNGVMEYAADVAKRWYVEHHALWKERKLDTPFKCKTPENAAAWKLVTDEFFGGIDRTPACPADPAPSDG